MANQVKYVLRAEEHFPFLLLVLQVSAGVFLVIVQQLSVKIGKKNTYFVGTGIFIVTLCWGMS
jgi:Na+/melibiose symporter-like transporter